jgi:hypothetical protein
MVRVVKAEINSPLDDYRKSIKGCHGKFLSPSLRNISPTHRDGRLANSQYISLGHVVADSNAVS